MKPSRLITLMFFSFLLNAICAQNVSAKYSVKNIKANTKRSDYGTTFFGPNRVYFASNHEASRSLGGKLNNFADTYEAPNYDLYKGLVAQTGEIDYIEKVIIAEASKYNKSNAAFSPDMRYVYFTQNNIVDGKARKDNNGNVNMKIYRANVSVNGQWSNIISLPFNSDDYSCTHPSVSEDNRILFFASDMPGSYGASDIYWVTIDFDGNYGEPQNLGDNVNTGYRENFPYVDKNILYFSSDRSDSKGGLDVYLVKLDEPDSKPMNLGTPINSTSDDFCFVIERQNKRGYFSSNRPGGKGDDDIYYFTQDTDFLECKQTISGTILDKVTQKPIPGAIVTMYSHDNILLATYPVKIDGTYKFELACRGNYRVESYHYDYDKTFKSINFTPQIFSQEVNLFLNPKIKEPIVIVPEKNVVVEEKKEEPVKKKEVIIPSIISNNKEILDLPTVYFELDSYYITKEAEQIVKQAIAILNHYPDISIEFASHTDCRASDSYNLLLSDLRAKEVIEYMIDQGVAKERLIGRGYGESRPVNGCIDGVKCSEAEHLQNRRAEFIIIKK
jgi:outer membrane protein OmpA-like peptidoglycan-associated protein